MFAFSAAHSTQFFLTACDVSRVEALKYKAFNGQVNTDKIKKTG